jgi:predicted flap endonuclease-1-like 5' DNA nuclease
MPKVGAPASRALAQAGYTQLGQLAAASRAGLDELHGVGPKALRIIQDALDEHGLSLAD